MFLAPRFVEEQYGGPSGHRHRIVRSRGPNPIGAGQDIDAVGAVARTALLDFGWRLHIGHANDSLKDFGFGNGRSGGFQKTGGFLSPSNLAYDDSDWQAVDLPPDWAIGLPFKNDPLFELSNFKNSLKPLASVGIARRSFAKVPAQSLFFL